MEGTGIISVMVALRAAIVLQPLSNIDEHELLAFGEFHSYGDSYGTVLYFQGGRFDTHPGSVGIFLKSFAR